MQGNGKRVKCDDGNLEISGLAQSNPRIQMEVYLSEKLPLPRALRRVLKRRPKALTLLLPV